jgi:hypothetical protein
MPNYLKMPKKSQVLALLELGWSYRRIEAETGVRRETVSRYDQARQANAAKAFPGSDASAPIECGDVAAGEDSNAAKTFVGSEPDPAKTFPPRAFGSPPAIYPSAITEKLDGGTESAAHLADWSRSTVQGELRIGETVRARLRHSPGRGRVHCAPVRKGEVDFFRGAPRWTATGSGDVRGCFA